MGCSQSNEKADDALLAKTPTPNRSSNEEFKDNLVFSPSMQGSTISTIDEEFSEVESPLNLKDSAKPNIAPSGNSLKTPEEARPIEKFPVQSIQESKTCDRKDIDLEERGVLSVESLPHDLQSWQDQYIKRELEFVSAFRKQQNSVGTDRKIIATIRKCLQNLKNGDTSSLPFAEKEHILNKSIADTIRAHKRDKVKYLEAKQALEGRVHSLESQLKAVQIDHRNVVDNKAILNCHVDDAGTNLSTSSTTVADVNALKAQIEQLLSDKEHMNDRMKLFVNALKEEKSAHQLTRRNSVSSANSSISTFVEGQLSNPEIELQKQTKNIEESKAQLLQLTSINASLTSDKSILECRVSELAAVQSKDKETIESQQELLTQIKGQLEGARMELGLKSAAVGQLTEKHDNTTTMLESLQARLRAVEEENVCYQSEISAFKSTLVEKDAALVEANAAAAIARAQNEKLADDLGHMHDRMKLFIKSLKDEKDAHKATRSQLTEPGLGPAEQAKLQVTVTTVQAEKKLAEEKVLSLQSQVSELTVQSAKLSATLSVAEIQSASHSATIIDLQGQLLKLSESTALEKEGIEAELVDYKQRLAESLAAKAAVEARLDGHVQQLLDSSREKTELASRLAAHQQRLAVAEISLAEHKQQISDLTTSKEETVAHLQKSLSDTIQRVKKEKDAARIAQATADETHQTLLSEISTKQAELDNHKEQLDFLQVVHEATKTELEAHKIELSFIKAPSIEASVISSDSEGIVPPSGESVSQQQKDEKDGGELAASYEEKASPAVAPALIVRSEGEDSSVSPTKAVGGDGEGEASAKNSGKKKNSSKKKK